MSAQKEPYTGLVPFESHYEVFKNVEDRLQSHLSGLDHEYFPIGLRVAYDQDESPSEPGVMPYAVDFGYLGPLEEAINCQDKETDYDIEMLAEATKNAPIPISFLDELVAYAKAELEKLAEQPLRVGVYIVLNGSQTLGYSSDCPCPNKKKRYCYYDTKTKTIKCYCTTRSC